MPSSNISRPTHRLGTELAAMGLLVVIVLLFLAPLLLGWAPAIFDDAAVETLPALVHVARNVQSGSVPLWDESTFAGAKPTYADNGWLIFYPPMYAFFLASQIDDLVNSHLVLMLLPYALHLAWATVGGYLFARLVMDLHPLAAMLVGLIYGLSPEMGYQLSMTPAAITLSHLPWCALGMARFLQTGSVRWWLGGTLLLALLNCSGNPNYLLRVNFVLAATIVVAGLVMFSESRGQRRAVAVRWLAAVGMMALAVGLAGLAWAGTLDAATWIRQSIPQALSEEFTARAARHSSMHPLNLVTLLIPVYFGASDSSYFWGAGLLLSKHVTLTGGLAIIIAALLAATTRLFCSPSNQCQAALRCWTWVATILLIGAGLTMLGRYTPFFRAACATLPWFFEFPHPVYYRFALCWAMALLVGVGVSTLLESAAAGQRVRRVVMVGVSLAVAAAVLGLAAGYRGDWTSFSGWQTLAMRDQWSWYLWRVAFCPGLVALVLLTASRWFDARRFGACLALAATAETAYVAWFAFYATGYLGPQQDITDPVAAPRCYRPQDDPRLRELLPLAREQLADRTFRFTSDDSVWDNVAWLVGGRAAMGYAAKPLIPAMADVIKKFSMPGNIVQWDEPPEQLFSNLNVRYLVTHNSSYESSRLATRTVDRPLPFVFTQQHIVAASAKQQLEKLMSGDLRQAVFMDPDLPAHGNAPWTYTTEPAVQTQPADAFEQLQRRNAIEEVRWSGANQLNVKIQVQQPSMLVINQCWHSGWTATVDGQPAAVYPVNHMQQSIWLDAGQHTIVTSFFPPKMKQGLIISALSLLVFVGVALLAGIRGSRRMGKGSERGSEQITG